MQRQTRVLFSIFWRQSVFGKSLPQILGEPPDPIAARKALPEGSSHGGLFVTTIPKFVTTIPNDIRRRPAGP